MAKPDIETVNLAVIEVTADCALELGRRFGFEVEYGSDEMLALQAAIYRIFGQHISKAEQVLAKPD